MTGSLMSSNLTKSEENLLENPEKLQQHLNDRIEEIGQILDDDEDFCIKDIDSSLQYIETIERKFYEKIQELKAKLDKIRRENQITSETNKNQSKIELNNINQSLSLKRYREALMKFKTYEERFKQRTTLNQQIPKLYMNEVDIEQFFSADYKPPIQPISLPTPTVSIIDDTKQDSTDDIQLTTKQRLRQEKIIESGTISKDDKFDGETSPNEKNPPDNDLSEFGSRSKRLDNQPSPINDTIRNDTKSPSTTDTPRPRFTISTRLAATSNSKNLPFSGRDISVSSVQNNDVKSGQVRSTPTPPSSVATLNQRQTKPINYNKIETLPLNTVSHYQHERNIFLLMICNGQYIVLFKNQLNRSDRWHLGAIQRGNHTEGSLDWHDGLIISMGFHERNIMYMFTECEFCIYSINGGRKLDSRILPRGSDDSLDANNVANNESQRGIGTVFGKHMYHIYLNRNSRWTLSKFLVEKVVHLYDYDLTILFPDVERFIHLSVNDKTIGFLVQMYDSSYAVVFCSTNNCTTNEYPTPIILLNAEKPLTIYSANIEYLNDYIFFINDPSGEILHILCTQQYLQSLSIIVHALCYVADKHELMIVTNNSISSINLNHRNLFSAK